MPGKEQVFDGIIEALHTAVVQAQRTAERQYEHFLDQYLKKGTNEPDTIEIAVPSLRPNAAEGEVDHIKVPLICLAAPSAIKIKELTVEFETQLSHIDSKFVADLDAPTEEAKKATMAKVKICFQGTDPPEGVQRAIEIMLKRMP